MNLFYLTETMIGRVRACQDYNVKRPLIRVFDSDMTPTYFDNLFTNEDDFWYDLRILFSIWNELVPDDESGNPSTIESKQLEICQFLGGKRNCNDVLLLMEWLNKRCDVDSFLIRSGIDSSEQ